MKKTKKCRAVLVDAPGDFNHKLWFSTRLDYLQYTNCRNFLSGFNPKQIILISLEPDEKIEVGDVIYNSRENVVEAVISIEDLEFISIINSNDELIIFKVIATEEQISKEYMGQFVDEYNEFDSYSGM